jgi:putative membrane protein
MRWSPARLLSALALGAWASLFWYLMITDRTSFYLSPRTDWVVPLGAVLLTAAALGRVLSARVSTADPVTRWDALGIGLVVAPVVVVLALPQGALGSYAASRRSSFVGAGFVSSDEDLASGELSLIDIAGAVRSREGMEALAQRAGSEVSFVGFVTRDDATAADEFMLTRFLISCCVADALSVQIRVVGAPPGQFDEDEWVRVTGTIYPLGQEIAVDATEVVSVPRPKDPYLSP